MSQMYHANARNADQRAVMAQIEKDGVCSFCPEHMPTYHPHPIIKKGAYWYVTRNAWPYEHTAHHFLIVTNAHLENSSGLSAAAAAELFLLIRWLEEEFKIEHGTLLLRTGDMAKTGGTVKHLHAQYVVADNSGEPVITRVG